MKIAVNIDRYYINVDVTFDNCLIIIIDYHMIEYM